MPDEIRRLRRFAVATGLALLTYAAAGISIEADAKLVTFGVPFQIRRPELLPIALVLASLYGSVCFYYYAMMLGTSPYRRRRDILNGLYAEGAAPGHRIWMYFGASQFETSPWRPDHDWAEKQAEMLRGAFPKFGRARVKAEPKYSDAADEDGREYLIWAVSCHIPVRCRIAGLIEDFDYTLPLWLNLGALLWFTLRVATRAA